MRFIAVCVVFVISLAVSGSPITAQEGHPLTGTWYGEYGTGAAQKDIVIVMKWDGRSVTGLMNPGPGATPLRTAVLDVTPGKPGTRSLNNPEGTEPIPPTFRVRIEVGDLVLEGTMQNPVGGNRSVVGTYTRGNEKGPFRMKRL